MAQNFPRLCGGTFLTLLLRALKKKHKNGFKQGLTEPECFMGLIRVITPKYDFPAAESTIKQDTSKYKNCVLDPSKSTWLPFAVPEHMTPFDEAVRSNYNVVLRRMIDFADKFLDMDVMGNWLVNALLELIDDDDIIEDDTLFYIQPDGSAVTKNAMLQQNNFKIQPFLLGIWHYVSMNVADSTIGQETLENYLTDAPSEKGDKRTLKNTIGRSKRFQIEVNILPKQQNVKAKADKEDFPIYEDDIAPELTGVPPIIVLPKAKEERVALSDDDFAIYLAEAKEKYSMVRTLLYFYEPRPFYDFYVCNTIEQRIPVKERGVAYRLEYHKNVTAETLLECSNFIILNGTGGIGKSMMMRHLLLDAIAKYRETKRLPIFVPLNNYSEGTDLIKHVYKNFGPLSKDKSIEDLQTILRSGRAIVLFDGLDEIDSKNRLQFEQGLEYFTDRYSENLFVISTRPYTRISAYNRFTIMNLLPFNKQQALTLIDKLDYRADTPALKQAFRDQLDSTLFETHKAFAQNPLLLTIMLMTFEQYAKIPPKMHRFYQEAYETLANKHDAMKVSYERQFLTGLNYDDFADYFAEFCAVTYYNQKYELTEREVKDFFDNMIIVSEDRPSFTYKDFLHDLCACMCLMYSEGRKYYFVHRSFQEYFCAVYFSKQMDEKLYDIATDVFERIGERTGDKTFAMLYDMIPRKIEKFVFIPYLKELLNECTTKDDYWTYLEKIHPIINYEHGETYDPVGNEPKSFLCAFIISLLDVPPLDSEKIPFFEACVVETYGIFDPEFHMVSDEDGESYGVEGNDAGLHPFSDLPVYYTDFLDEPEVVGWDFQIPVEEIREKADEFKDILDFLNDDSFPFKQEYYALKKYLAKLEQKDEVRPRKGNLFDRLR